MQNLLFLAVAIAIVATNAEPPSYRSSRVDGRIFGGRNATIEQHPHMVSITKQSSFECPGAMISASHVLTSAWCALWTGTLAEVRAGSSQWRRGGSVHRVDKVIAHEGYRGEGWFFLENNIGLVKVSPPFELDASRRPIEMLGPRDEVGYGAQLVATGWGHGEWPLGMRERLVSANMSRTGSYECHVAWQAVGAPPRGTFCSGGREQNICSFDFGGPLTLDGRLAGVASQGYGDCRRPSLFVEVARYRDWIAKHLDD